jgi:hypothetical protein
VGVEKGNNMYDRFNIFKETYDQAIKAIELFAKDKDMATITNWLLDTEINFYTIFGVNTKYGEAQESAELFSSLLHEIHHALVDDGEICFPVIYDMPELRFLSEYDFINEYNNDSERIRIFKRKNDFIDKLLKEGKINEVDCIKAKNDKPIKFLTSIEEFIVAADEAHVLWLKKCFLNDSRVYGKECAIKHYQEYRAFDSAWGTL